MKCKFYEVRLKGIGIIIEIGAPTQKIQQEVDNPKPYMIFEFNIEVYFFHLKTLLLWSEIEMGYFYSATIINLLLKNAF
jgi:hypothetical protein